MSERERLLLCPFCGKAGRVIEEADHHGGYFSLGCSAELSDGPEGGPRCPGALVYYTEPADILPAAIAAWNRRAHPEGHAGQEPGHARWQPIEAAPKDGTDLVLWDGEVLTVGGWISDVDQGADYEGQLKAAGWWRLDGSSVAPTHWMPLPTAPGQEPSGGQRIEGYVERDYEVWESREPEAGIRVHRDVAQPEAGWLRATLILHAATPAGPETEGA